MKAEPLTPKGWPMVNGPDTAQSSRDNSIRGPLRQACRVWWGSGRVNRTTYFQSREDFKVCVFILITIYITPTEQPHCYILIFSQ